MVTHPFGGHTPRGSETFVSQYHHAKFPTRSPLFPVQFRYICFRDQSFMVGYSCFHHLLHQRVTLKLNWHLLLHRSCGSHTSDACRHEWFNECDVIPAEYWGIAQSQGHIRKHTNALCCSIWLVLFCQTASSVGS